MGLPARTRGTGMSASSLGIVRRLPSRSASTAVTRPSSSIRNTNRQGVLRT